MNVLIVDEFRESADLLRELLELDGHFTRCAYSAGEALARLDALTWEAILVDLSLDGRPGFDLAHKARDIGGSAVVLVAVSGTPKDHFGVLTPFDQFLEKPINFARLDAILRRPVRG